MENIWGFCLQTLTVSLVAAMLLLLKWLLKDKLSPRWQYGVWGLLALRVLIPVRIGRTVVAGIGVWLETGKALAERMLNSAYSAEYVPISLGHVFPVFRGIPGSVTDWLFIIYGVGVGVWVLRYLISYIRLRLRLRQGEAPSGVVLERMEEISRRYGLKPCTVVAVPGLDSAFVCGVVKPVLAVPDGVDVEEKVLLHELLHLKYGDVAQGVFWAALRCLHWCNPFLQYVFNRVGNDLESLCDQRVLERLEGEERREYGRILLSMANSRYPRTPGTSSVSNGGKNIARRIDAIVRFKKYPRGMALVSLCIVLALVSPLLFGTAAAFETADYQPDSELELSKAMAATRVRRCTTLAGAIDTYAKGLMQQNGVYLAIASPLSRQAELESAMRSCNFGCEFWNLDNGEGLEYLDGSEEYGVFDLTLGDDGSYRVWLTLSVTDFEEEAHQDWPLTSEGIPIQSGTVVIPLRLWQEGNSWVAEECGERILANQRFSQIEYYGEDMPFLTEKTVECQTGTITVSHRNKYQIDNTVTTNDVFGWTSFDPTIKSDAKFTSVSLTNQVVYHCDLTGENRPRRNIAMQVWPLETEEDVRKAETGEETLPLLEENNESASGGSSNGYSYTSKWVDESWDGELWCGGGTGFGSSAGIDQGELPLLPQGYLIHILVDGLFMEEIVIKGVQP